MDTVMAVYQRLQHQHRLENWWPAEAAFEVAAGAFLTQNTNWSNVEKALLNLRAAQALNVTAVASMPLQELEQLIRPSGFFRQKAQRLRLFCRHLEQHHGGSIERLLQQELAVARRELLNLSGIGRETADSILLYAGQRLSFVVDSYTRRLFGRIGVLGGSENYEHIRQLFMAVVPADPTLYQDYHALIVTHCKELCRKAPLCHRCHCADICDHAAQLA